MKRALLIAALTACAGPLWADGDGLSEALQTAQGLTQAAPKTDAAAVQSPAQKAAGQALQTQSAFLAAHGGAQADAMKAGLATLQAWLADGAARMGIPAPLLWIDNSKPKPDDYWLAAATTDRGGSVTYMLVNGNELPGILSSAQNLSWFKVIVYHELDHILRGDVTPASRAEPSDPDRIESQEVRADIEGGFFSGDPAPVVAYFKEALVADAAKCKGAEPAADVFASFDPAHPTAAQIRAGSRWRKEQDPLHAEPLERYFIFAELSRMMASGGVSSVDGLAAENGPLRRTVKKEMADPSLPDWSGTAP